MKLKHIIKTLGGGALLLLLAQGITACSDVNEWDIDSTYDRLFGTNQDKISVDASAITAEVEWEYTPNTKYYIIEVSVDSLSDDVPMGQDGSLVYGEDGSITKSPYTLTGLKGETTYYLRIKSMSDKKESRWVYLDDFKFTTDEEQIFNEIAENDVTDESIRLTWDPSLEVTHLMYQKEGDVAVQHELTEEEKAAGELILSGLDPMTKYILTIYNGETKRGNIEVTTDAAVMVDSEVKVDALTKTVTFSWGENIGRLTGYVLLEGNVYPSDQTQTALTAEQESSRTLTFTNLKGNTTYTIAVMRDRTVRALQVFKTWAAIPDDYKQVQAGNVDEWDAALASASGKVAVVLTGDIDLTNGGTTKIPASITSLLIWGGDQVSDQKAYTFKSKGISFSGDMDVVEFYNVNAYSNNSTGNYIFDFNKTSSSINAVNLTACVIDEARGVFRIRSGSTGTLKNIVVEDCFVRNIGSYGFMSQESSDFTLSAVTFKNTTYVPHSSGKYLIQNKGNDMVNVSIDQCTLYGFAYAMFEDKPTGFVVDISNTLMGGLGKRKFFNNFDVSKINSVANVYITSDCVFETTIGETTLEYSDADFFGNPASMDFTVKVADYKSYGDQRWNK